MVLVRDRLTPEVGAVLIQTRAAARDKMYAGARVAKPPALTFCRRRWPSGIARHAEDGDGRSARTAA